MRVVVIDAGVGGLTAAAKLAREGADVTVLEAHVYPGGCAGSFFHQGYCFDVGATLAAGFFPGGPMDLVSQGAGVAAWPVRAANPAMVVHLPGGEKSVIRWTDERRWAERHAAFGVQADRFWQWQERTADALWDLAMRRPSWPPQTFADGRRLIQTALSWLGQGHRNASSVELLASALRRVSSHLRRPSKDLRLFIDAQLLISAQTTSRHANALYGAAALDLPRRGAVHVEGGMGAISRTLEKALKDSGGEIHFRQAARRIVIEGHRPIAVETNRGDAFPSDVIIANLTPWDLARLLGEYAPRRLRRVPPTPKDAWGAFVLYVGLDESAVPSDFPLHHQVIVAEPLAEGNTVFISGSPAWDQGRAPRGRRAFTMSTHTSLARWWELYETDRAAYDQLKTEFSRRVLAAAEVVMPQVQDAADLRLPGTPVTFERFTRRYRGWVGGFPQTNLFRTWGPRAAQGIWMVGDSIFPGQSTAAVALGGLRVAESVLDFIGKGSEHAR